MSKKGSTTGTIRGFLKHEVFREAVQNYFCKTDKCIWNAMCDVIEKRGKKRPNYDGRNTVRRIISLSKSTDKYGFRVHYLNRGMDGFYVITGPDAEPLDRDTTPQFMEGQICNLSQQYTYVTHSITLIEDAIKYGGLPAVKKIQLEEAVAMLRACGLIIRNVMRDAA